MTCDPSAANPDAGIIHLACGELPWWTTPAIVVSLSAFVVFYYGYWLEWKGNDS